MCRIMTEWRNTGRDAVMFDRQMAVFTFVIPVVLMVLLREFPIEWLRKYRKTMKS